MSGLLRLFLKLVSVSQAKEATPARLRGPIFGKSTEKRKKGKAPDTPSEESGGKEIGEVEYVSRNPASATSSDFIISSVTRRLVNNVFKRRDFSFKDRFDLFTNDGFGEGNFRFFEHGLLRLFAVIFGV